MSDYAELTELENRVLDAIKQDCFYRESDDGECWCFADEFAKDAGITVESCKGVLGSLVQKKVINIWEGDRNFNTNKIDNLLQVSKKYR